MPTAVSSAAGPAPEAATSVPTVAAGTTGKIEIDLRAALLGLESCIADEYGSVTLGLMQRLREALYAAT